MSKDLEYHQPSRALIESSSGEPVILFSEKIKPVDIESKINALSYLAIHNSGTDVSHNDIKSALVETRGEGYRATKTAVHDIQSYLEDSGLLIQASGRNYLKNITVSNRTERTLDDEDIQIRDLYANELERASVKAGIVQATRYMMGLIDPEIEIKPLPRIESNKQAKPTSTSLTLGGKYEPTEEGITLDEETKERVVNILTAPYTHLRNHHEAVLVLDALLNPSVSSAALEGEILELSKEDAEVLISKSRAVLGEDRFWSAWNARITRGELRTGSKSSTIRLTSGGGKQRGEKLRETTDTLEQRTSDDALLNVG